MESLTIIIPKYPVKVKLSNARRIKYITSSDNLAKKYKTDEYEFKHGKLINKISKKPVILNSKSYGTPRYITISGNSLYSGLHERVRMKIIAEMKAAIKPHLPTTSIKELIGIPVKIVMKIYRTVGNTQWDIDNFNIFWFKAFFDTLRDEKIIGDDSIEFIVSIGSDFIPITNDDDRKLEFVITKSNRPEITNHLLYQQQLTDFNYNAIPLNTWKIKIKQLNAGQIFIDYDNKTYYIGIGKRYVIFNAAHKALVSVAVQALIMNEPISISKEMQVMFKDEFSKIMFSHHIPVYINNDVENEEIKKLFIKTKFNNGHTTIES